MRSCCCFFLTATTNQGSQKKKIIHRKMLLETYQLAGEAQDITYYSGSSLREGKQTNSSHHKKRKLC